MWPSSERASAFQSWNRICRLPEPAGKKNLQVVQAQYCEQQSPLADEFWFLRVPWILMQSLSQIRLKIVQNVAVSA